MVRLKEDMFHGILPVAQLFQYLLVRLKALETFYRVELVEFQYLLVRLKVLMLLRSGKKLLISIPLGTIKRDKSVLFEIGYIISIPLGTIKRSL